MYKLTIYIPSTRNTNQVIDNTKYVAIIAKTLSSVFGGCTSAETNGYYVANDGSLVLERIDCVYTFSGNAEQLARTGDYVAKWLKRVMKQESVLITLEEIHQVSFV